MARKKLETSGVLERMLSSDSVELMDGSVANGRDALEHQVRFSLPDYEYELLQAAIRDGKRTMGGSATVKRMVCHALRAAYGDLYGQTARKMIEAKGLR